MNSDSTRLDEAFHPRHMTEKNNVFKMDLKLSLSKKSTKSFNKLKQKLLVYKCEHSLTRLFSKKKKKEVRSGHTVVMC